jgi:hypothetical protein
LAINDGRAEGHPKEPASEWSSDRETSGAKIRLSWEEPVVVENVWLFDRPNATDHVTGAWVQFSDGSYKVAEGFANDGSTPVQLNFPEKQIIWMEVIVTAVGPRTVNAGLSEVAVFKDLPEPCE